MELEVQVPEPPDQALSILVKFVYEDVDQDGGETELYVVIYISTFPEYGKQILPEVYPGEK